jgi:uncharacterized protein YuzE
MAITLSHHLARRLDEKRRRTAYIEAAITKPDWTRPDRTWTGVTVSFKAIAELNHRIIRGCTPSSGRRYLCHDRLLGPRSPAPMIKTSYDPEADVIEVEFAAKGTVYDGSQEVSPGIMLHVDTEGRVIGVEIEAVSLRMAGNYRGKVKAAAE